MFAVRLAVLAAAWTGIPSPAFAQGIITNIPGCDFRTGWLMARCIPLFIAHLIGFLFGLLSVFFILNVIFAGFQMAFGSLPGNERSPAKARLKNAVIGLIVSLSVYLIFDTVLTVILGA